MNKHHVRLLVTLVLVMATLAVGWGIAQARPVANWSPASNTSVSTRPIAIVTSGDPDVGQTVVRHGLERNAGGESCLVSWFQRVRSVWAAWYLRAAL